VGLEAAAAIAMAALPMDEYECFLLQEILLDAAFALYERQFAIS